MLSFMREKNLIERKFYKIEKKQIITIMKNLVIIFIFYFLQMQLHDNLINSDTTIKRLGSINVSNSLKLDN